MPRNTTQNKYIDEEIFKTLIKVFKVKTDDSKIKIKRIDQEDVNNVFFEINGIDYKLEHIESKARYKTYRATEFVFESENSMYPTYLFKVSHLNDEEAMVHCNALIHLSNDINVPYGWDSFGKYFRNTEVAHALINISKSLMNRYFNTSLNEKVVEFLENNEWNVEVYEDGLELQKYSPASQDFIVKLEGYNLEEWLAEAQEAYDTYDPSSEAMIWVDEHGHGINGAPHELIDLIKDLLWCKSELFNLVELLKKFKIENQNETSH